MPQLLRPMQLPQTLPRLLLMPPLLQLLPAHPQPSKLLRFLTG